jgi:hypothetical protein
MRAALCFSFVLSMGRLARGELIVEIENAQGVNLTSGEPEMPFNFAVGSTSFWNLVATQSDVGKTFSAPFNLLPIYAERLTSPATIFVQINCCGGGSRDFFSPPLLNTGTTIPDPVLITRVAPNLGPNLVGYRVTDVTQTIDEITITQVSGDRYNRHGTHTIRIWGDRIPEPTSSLLLVFACIFLGSLRIRLSCV